MCWCGYKPCLAFEVLDIYRKEFRAHYCNTFLSGISVPIDTPIELQDMDHDGDGMPYVDNKSIILQPISKPSMCGIMASVRLDNNAYTSIEFPIGSDPHSGATSIEAVAEILRQYVVSVHLYSAHKFNKETIKALDIIADYNRKHNIPNDYRTIVPDHCRDWAD